MTIVESIRAIAALYLIGMLCAANVTAQLPQTIELDNRLLRISFDKPTRAWSLYENISGEWQTVLHHASINFTAFSPDSVFIEPEGKEVTGTFERYSDAIGTGRRLSVRVSDSHARWEISFILYDTKKVCTIALSLTNTTAITWKMNELHLVDVTKAAYFQFGTSNILMHVNGYQSWSPSEVTKLDSVSRPASYWSTLFYEPEAHQTRLLGFITNSVSANSFKTDPFDAHTNQLCLTALSSLKTLEIPRGASFKSDRLMISLEATPQDNLQRYGEYLYWFAPQMNKPFTPSIIRPVPTTGKDAVPTGWCSWYYYYQHITEDSIVQNINAAAQHLKNAGMKYIQIDDGFQIAAGDWNTNNKFPHGHKWLVEEIHAKGFLAGLWVAPFAIAESSSVYKEHRDWLLRDTGDSLKEYFANDWWGGKIFSLDPSNPHVQSWLENLFYTVTNQWGYDYVKIDFLYFAHEGGKYFSNVTPAQAYQMGLAAIRNGVGSDKFILGCGAPMGSSIGYVDGMRIGGDIYAAWDGITPGVNAASQRTFYHNNVWYDDPDCLVVRDPLTIDQARAWASVVALSGQMNMLSDNLTALPQDRLELLKMTLPSYGVSATPLDLFSPPSEDGLLLRSADRESTLTLPGKWKFAVGDSAVYREVSFDDRDWKDIPVPAHWENAGFPDVDGFVWYRVKFTLPSGWKRGPITFSFGRIDDNDQTFLNGVLIGETGTMPPNYSSEWVAFRVYTIPDSVVNWGGENTLAVRVYDGSGPGGIYSIRQLNLPSVWNLPVNKGFEKWNIIGVFNWTKSALAAGLSPAQLGLSPRKTYLLYELWSDKFLGELKNEFSITLSATSSKILSIHEKKDRPFILSTSRHITQGAIDIANEQWDEKRRTLSVTSDNLVPGEYHVIVYVPSGYKLRKVVAPLKTEVSTTSESVQKVTLHVGGKSKVAWKVVFE